MTSDRHCSGWRRSFFVNKMYSWIWRLNLRIIFSWRSSVLRWRWILPVIPAIFVGNAPDADNPFFFDDAGDELFVGVVFDVAANGGVGAFEHAESVAGRGGEGEGRSFFKIGDRVGGASGEIGDGCFRWRDVMLKLDLITGDAEFGCGFFSDRCRSGVCFFWIHDGWRLVMMDQSSSDSFWISSSVLPSSMDFFKLEMA
jgi:hypothetical protein